MAAAAAVTASWIAALVLTKWLKATAEPACTTLLELLNSCTSAAMAPAPSSASWFAAEQGGTWKNGCHFRLIQFNRGTSAIVPHAQPCSQLTCMVMGHAAESKGCPGLHCLTAAAQHPHQRGDGACRCSNRILISCRTRGDMEQWVPFPASPIQQRHPCLVPDVAATSPAWLWAMLPRAWAAPACATLLLLLNSRTSAAMAPDAAIFSWVAA